MVEDRGERFVSEGIFGIMIDDGKCDLCEHVHKDGQSCEAFPDGIPAEILNGDYDHSNSYPGDNGIQFKEAGG